jgi:hypothetical protein
VPAGIVSAGEDVMSWSETDEFSEWCESLPIAEPSRLILVRAMWCAMKEAHSKNTLE